MLKPRNLKVTPRAVEAVLSANGVSPTPPEECNCESLHLLRDKLRREIDRLRAQRIELKALNQRLKAFADSDTCISRTNVLDPKHYAEQIEHERVEREELKQRLEELTAALAKANAEREQEHVERKQAEESLRQLAGRLLRLQDEERWRIARELHDTTAQNLTAAAISLALANNAAADLRPSARSFLSESLDLVKQSVRELRTLSYLLHPPLLEELGLISIVSWYVEGFTHRSGIQVRLEVCPELGRLPDDVELALFRVVQESLTNIYRHAESATATIRLTQRLGQVILTVADQGHGLPPGLRDTVNSSGALVGVGLAGMRERVRQLGGRLEIESAMPGTTITVVLPAGGERA